MVNKRLLEVMLKKNLKKELYGSTNSVLMQNVLGTALELLDKTEAQQQEIDRINDVNSKMDALLCKNGKEIMIAEEKKADMQYEIEQLKAQNAVMKQAWESLNIGFMLPDIVVIGPKENRYCSTTWKGTTGAYRDWEYARKAIERVKEVFDSSEPIEYHNPAYVEVLKVKDLEIEQFKEALNMAKIALEYTLKYGVNTRQITRTINTIEAIGGGQSDNETTQSSKDS